MALLSEPLVPFRIQHSSLFQALDWLEQKQWEERQTLRWFFRRIDLKYFLRVRDGIPGPGRCSYLFDYEGEYKALWQAEYDRRTLLRPLLPPKAIT